MRESHTAIIERHMRIHGLWQTEPYEAAWATELIYFVYLSVPLSRDVVLQPQISADGQRWVNDGAPVALVAAETECAIKRTHFGGWCRLSMNSPADAESTEIDIYLTLKG